MADPAAATTTDRVVRRIEVVVCSGVRDAGGQVVLLQQPLRPAWRPYDLAGAQRDAGAGGAGGGKGGKKGAASQQHLSSDVRDSRPEGVPRGVRYKPSAQRLEVDLPLDATSDNANYNGETDDASLRVSHVTLRSQPVAAGGAASGAQQAVGLLRGDRLYLLPVDAALQLRPHLAHLGTAAAVAASAAAAAAAAGHGGATPTAAANNNNNDSDDDAGGNDTVDEDAAPTAVEVQVRRRETERQQQARLKSYGHLAAEEEAEPWVELRLAPDADGVAEWRRLEAHAARAGAPPAPAPMSRVDYLDLLAPRDGGGGGDDDEYVGGGRATTTAPPAAPMRGLAIGGGGSLPLRPDAEAAVTAALDALLAKHGLANLNDARGWLKEQPVPARDGAALGDAELGRLLLAGAGDVQRVRGVFVRTRVGHGASDAVRGVVLELLRGAEGGARGVRRQDVLAAADAAGVGPVPDAQYQRVMRELCTPHGNQWTLKEGVGGGGVGGGGDAAS